MSCLSVGSREVSLPDSDQPKSRCARLVARLANFEKSTTEGFRVNYNCCQSEIDGAGCMDEIEKDEGD